MQTRDAQILWGMREYGMGYKGVYCTTIYL